MKLAIKTKAILWLGLVWLVVFTLLAMVVMFLSGCSASEPAYINLLRGTSNSTPIYVQVQENAGIVVFTHGLASDNHTPCTLAELSGKITDDDLVGLTTTQELDNKTLDASVAKGTWTNSGTWTLPPFALGGSVTLNSQVFDAGSGELVVDTDDDAAGIRVRSTQNAQTGAQLVGEHDSDNPLGGDIVMRWLGIGRNDADETIQYHGIYFQISDPTDGSEDSRYTWGAYVDGSWNDAMILTGAGVLTVDDSYGTFDDHDDAKLLKDAIKDGKKEVLEAIGVYQKKYKMDSDGMYIKDDRGNLIQVGYMVNVQDYFKLLSGGVYQNRDKIDTLELRIAELEKLLGGKE